MSYDPELPCTSNCLDDLDHVPGHLSLRVPSSRALTPVVSARRPLDWGRITQTVPAQVGDYDPCPFSLLRGHGPQQSRGEAVPDDARLRVAVEEDEGRFCMFGDIGECVYLQLEVGIVWGSRDGDAAALKAGGQEGLVHRVFNGGKRRHARVSV